MGCIGLSLAARLDPDLAADASPWGSARPEPPRSSPHVAGDELEALRALLAEGVEERLDDRLVSSRRRPNQPAGGR